MENLMKLLQVRERNFYKLGQQKAYWQVSIMHRKVGIQTTRFGRKKTVIHSKIDFQNVTSASTLKICTSLSKCGLFLESVLHHFLKLELLLGQQKGAIWPSNISFCTLTMYYYYVVLQYVTKLPHCGDGRREQRPAQPKTTKSLVLLHSSK